jgi:hypothetical protein
MRLLWTLLKVVIALVLVIPVSIIVLATVLGVFGALLGLAILALKLAVVGLLCWGAFRLVGGLMRGPAPHRNEIKPLPAVDPHYEAAMRELDRELGEVR